MMRPDHIYLAMLMVKHSTLAGACIFGFKIIASVIKTLSVRLLGHGERHKTFLMSAVAPLDLPQRSSDTDD